MFSGLSAAAKSSLIDALGTVCCLWIRDTQLLKVAPSYVGKASDPETVSPQHYIQLQFYT